MNAFTYKINLDGDGAGTAAADTLGRRRTGAFYHFHETLSVSFHQMVFFFPNMLGTFYFMSDAFL